ncbi:MAG: DNA methylase [Lachnospiraceae bacterium]|nr:DNA methylase [Lachnospiraceae bacterium]
MAEKNRSYIAIDLKSFYASVECYDRGLDPLNTNLVVADVSRTEKTICLAVSPSLKSFGISGRARLFEVVSRVKEINNERKYRNKGKLFSDKSYFYDELMADNSLELDYIAAPPRMQRYEDVSSKVYSIYLRYVAPEDMHVYSVDEVFLDVTDYLNTYQMSAHELAIKMIREVLNETGITATAGVATNMYLCKVAMDIVAKHMKADADGVRIAELDEEGYRNILWNHRPLTDFWRVGKGIAKRLEKNGMFTMGDIARRAIEDEDYLYKMFGVNAEYLIDHAFGREETLIKDIKSYKPKANSFSSGQVLSEPYSYEKARIIVREMADIVSLDLVKKRVVTDQLVLDISYDRESLNDSTVRKHIGNSVVVDHYGRAVPKPAHGSINLARYTSSTRLITDAILELYDRICDKKLLVRKLNITTNHIILEKDIPKKEEFEQLSLFSDVEEVERERKAEEEELIRERKAQEAVIEMKKRFGKNAIFKGTDLQEGATTIERNQQIGGHKA